jgi:hypothetical protein
VSLSYLVWLLALYERIAPRDDTSSWYQIHMHQARWFGPISSIVGLIAFTWPIVVTLVLANVSATLWLYGFAMILDVVLFVVWLILALRYSRQAAQAKLFTIPLVARLTGTWKTKP